MGRRRFLIRMLLGVALTAVTPAVALAQDPPQPIDAPEGFADVRARFENLTPEEVAAAGYRADPPLCIAEPGLGGMGVHALNPELMGAQFPTAEMDPENPPILLLSANLQRVIGLEWEAKDIGQGETELFGQKVVLQPGHPGVPEPHYMLHAYFREDGQVLFAPFDPMVICGPPNTDTIAAAAEDDNRAPGALAVVLGVFAVTVTWLLKGRFGRSA